MDFKRRSFNDGGGLVAGFDSHGQDARATNSGLKGWVHAEGESERVEGAHASAREDARPTDVGTDETVSSVIFHRSPIHGTGGFARVDISAGTRVIEYVGEKISKQESLARCEGSNEYIFAMDEEHDLDGNVDWNPARFLNHSCEPNCEAQFMERRIGLVAIRDIRAGEELTFNYSYDLEDYREHPCRCGAKMCVGYIVAEEFFEHVRRQGIRKTA